MKKRGQRGVRADAQSTTGAGGERHDCRCVCGKLLARASPQGIEVKCNRCERVLLITWSEAHGMATTALEQVGAGQTTPNQGDPR